MQREPIHMPIADDSGDPVPAPGTVLSQRQPVVAEVGNPPVRVRGVIPSAATISLVIIAAASSLFVLHWARAFFVPVTVGVILALVCNPAVRKLAKWRIPRALGATLVLGALWGVGALATYSVQDEVVKIADSLPSVAKDVAKRINAMRSEGNVPSSIGKVRDAAITIEKAAATVTGEPPARSSGLRVQLESSASRVRDFLWSGSAGLLTIAMQLIIITFLAYFLLATGEDMKRRWITTVGRNLSDKKSAVRMVDETAQRMQYTLLALVVTNVIYGLATGIAFYWLGMPNAGVWGIATMVAHFIPYFGTVVIAAAAALAGFVQHDTLMAALTPALVSLAIAAVVGNLIAVWLQSRTARTDPTTIFVGMLLFGWLWGGIGLLLGAPLMAMIKAICEHVHPLNSIAGFMQNGREPFTSRMIRQRVAQRSRARGPTQVNAA